MKMSKKQKKLIKKYSSHIPTITILLSMVLWVLAASLPAYILLHRSGGSYLGILCFLWGFLTPLYNFLFFIVWSSNITGLVALVYLHLKKYTTSVKIASVALLCALGSLFINVLPLNENGSTAPVIPGIGVYLWIASIAVILLGSVVAMRFTSKSR